MSAKRLRFLNKLTFLISHGLTTHSDVTRLKFSKKLRFENFMFWTFQPFPSKMAEIFKKAEILTNKPTYFT